MEETGMQSSIKCPEGRGPLICMKKYQYSRYRTEKNRFLLFYKWFVLFPPPKAIDT